MGSSITSPGMANPMTAQDDLILGGSSGAPTRKAVGTSGWVLYVNGSGHVEWHSLTAAQGDLVVGDASGYPTNLTVGSDYQLLVPISGVLTWVAFSAIPLTPTAPVIEYDDWTILNTDPHGQVFFVDTGLHSHTVNVELPLAGDMLPGWEVAFNFKDASGGNFNINVAGHSSDNILAVGGIVTTLTVTNVGAAVRLRSDGTNLWLIAEGYGI